MKNKKNEEKNKEYEKINNKIEFKKRLIFKKKILKIIE
jgi:hypothetical protein